jgi:hypothetical protein
MVMSARQTPAILVLGLGELMAKQQSITSLPRSPDDDRRGRMIKYSLTMGIRVVCVVLCVFARGWWLAVCAAGAIFLPYFAVVLANVSMSRPSSVQRPGTVVPLFPPRSGSSGPPESEPPESEPPASEPPA